MLDRLQIPGGPEIVPISPIDRKLASPSNGDLPTGRVEVVNRAFVRPRVPLEPLAAGRRTPRGEPGRMFLRNEAYLLHNRPISNGLRRPVGHHGAVIRRRTAIDRGPPQGGATDPDRPIGHNDSAKRSQFHLANFDGVDTCVGPSRVRAVLDRGRGGMRRGDPAVADPGSAVRPELGSCVGRKFSQDFARAGGLGADGGVC